MKFEQNDFQLIKKLREILQGNDNKNIAIACYDLGEFCRFYPRGRKYNIINSALLKVCRSKSRSWRRLGTVKTKQWESKHCWPSRSWWSKTGRAFDCLIPCIEHAYLPMSHYVCAQYVYYSAKLYNKNNSERWTTCKSHPFITGSNPSHSLA